MQSDVKVINAVDNYLHAEWERRDLLRKQEENDKKLVRLQEELIRVLKCTHPHRGVVVDGIRYSVAGQNGHEMLVTERCDDVVLRVNNKRVEKEIA